MDKKEISPCLIGHPFAPIGRGEDVRCTFRALQAAAVPCTVLDLYGANKGDPALRAEFGHVQVSTPGAINIFHLNGDEIAPAFNAPGGRLADDPYNIVYPAWELSGYPKEWAEQLDRFDEIWAPSQFIYDALRPVVSKPLHKMPLACDVVLSEFRSRRYFGIPESSCAFLYFFDLRSYSARKNPMAVIQAFEQLRAKHPLMDVCLVLKLHGGTTSPDAAAAIKKIAAAAHGRIILIDREISDNDVKNLVRCCDVFVSLHRSEGFGRGLAEAMSLSKPVVATAYSGNMDFMDSETACLVGYDLVPVGPGEYPFHEGQVWADAKVDEAAAYMEALAIDPGLRGDLGARAKLKVRPLIGYRAAGLSYRSKLEEARSSR